MGGGKRKEGGKIPASCSLSSSPPAVNSLIRTLRSLDEIENYTPTPPHNSSSFPRVVGLAGKQASQCLHTWVLQPFHSWKLCVSGWRNSTHKSPNIVSITHRVQNKYVLILVLNISFLSCKTELIPITPCCWVD